METYDFEVTIGFRVTADSKHDALRAALDVEASLNDSSIRASYGRTTVMRVLAPVMKRFRQTALAMPENPVQRNRADESHRYGRLLTPLLFEWTVVLSDQWGKEHVVRDVTAPTRERAIDDAKVKLYHSKSIMGPDVVSAQRTMT